MSDSDSDNSSSNEAEAQPNAAEKIQLPTTSSIPDRNESVLQMLPSDSLLDLDTEETENIPDEAPESAEEKIIIECNSKKSQKGKEGKEETKKTKKRPIQSDSDFQSSESKEEKKKPKTEQVVAGRSVAGIPVSSFSNESDFVFILKHCSELIIFIYSRLINFKTFLSSKQLLFSAAVFPKKLN
jgi:hypothetical protein